ncbi:MAG: sigE 1 [Nocardioides sp.]|jgi:DNA-directed RNA polymerase specialized sigma24 family protein|nr:sigE 1 [Nocardioides sp.]
MASPIDDDFEEYVAARWRPLVRAAVILGCSSSEAEDLVQTTLFQVYRSWDRVQVARDRDAYVYRMLGNAFRRSRARRWRGEVPHENVPDAAQAYQGLDPEKVDSCQ